MPYRLTLLLATTLVVGCSADTGPLNELSGLTTAAEPGHFWALNDGPNKPGDPVDSTLYLVDSTGAVVRTTTLDVPNRDWEDLARMDYAGQPFLVVADTGDNRGVHSVYHLRLVALPSATPAEQLVATTRTIDFTFPTGSLDCEAMAYDPITSDLVLVSKRETPPAVYRIPANAAPGEIHTAERIGTIQGLQSAAWWERILHPFQGPYAAQPTALDISADGRTVALLTYKNAYVWRRAGQGLFDGVPTVYPLPAIGQWEALAIEGGQLVIGAEGQLALHTIRLTGR